MVGAGQFLKRGTEMMKDKPAQRPSHVLLLLAMLVGGVILGGATYYALSTDSLSSDATIVLPLPNAGLRGEKAQANMGSEAESLPIQPLQPPVVVDSYDAAAIHSLNGWSVMSGTYGFIDSVTIDGERSIPLNSRALTNDDVLVVTGWAGHSGLGMSMPDVLFVMCGQVVGSVRVGNPRPDVAKAVHPYLDRSGWQARLSVAHMPRCGETTLTAFGLRV